MKYLIVGLILAGSWTGHLQAQQRARDGAVVGGTAGAILGGIIGHQNDETPEGAILGGVVGAVAGGLMGNARDQQIQRERYYQAQLYDQQQQLQQLQQRCVRMQDVISMTQSGLSDAVILNHIQTNGVDRRLEVSEIITLHRQGVSDAVITAMQSAPLATGSSSRLVQYSRPPQQPAVIVHETYEVLPPPPCYHYPMPRQSYFYYHYHR